MTTTAATFVSAAAAAVVASTRPLAVAGAAGKVGTAVE
jgi:hypothetical protein